MPANPYSHACLTVGCPEPVVSRGRCRLHALRVDQHRSLDSDRHHAHLYASARWRALRRDILAAQPICACSSCASPTGRWSLTRVVHHIEPHHSDEAKFFDPSNLVAMSKACHDALTQRERTGGRQSPETAPPQNRATVSCASAQVVTRGIEK